MNQELQINILSNKVDLLTDQVLLLQKMITNLTENKNNNNMNLTKELAFIPEPLAPNKSQDEWSPYSNSRQSPKVFNDTIEHVENCIKTAYLYRGCVFGGYVRNVVVPRLKNKTSPGYKDVDFWFKSQTDADLFVKQMGDKLYKLKDTDVEFQMNVYSFVRQQYMLKYKEGDGNIVIDVIVSPTLPVNDFDVNQLTYSPNGLKSYGNKPVDELIALIDSKTMTALQGFNGKLMDSMKHTRQANRLTKLSQTGWTINVDGFRFEITSNGKYYF